MPDKGNCCDHCGNDGIVSAMLANLGELVEKGFAEGSAKFKDISGKVDELKLDMVVVKDKTNRLHRVVLEDNGRPALTTRVAQVEQHVESKPHKWQFWATIIAAFIALLGSIIALMK